MRELMVILLTVSCYIFGIILVLYTIEKVFDRYIRDGDDVEPQTRPVRIKVKVRS